MITEVYKFEYYISIKTVMVGVLWNLLQILKAFGKQSFQHGHSKKIKRKKERKKMKILSTWPVSFLTFHTDLLIVPVFSFGLILGWKYEVMSAFPSLIAIFWFGFVGESWVMIAWTPIFRWNVHVEEIDELVGLTGPLSPLEFFLCNGRDSHIWWLIRMVTLQLSFYKQL